LPVTEDILLKWRLLMESGRKVGHTYSDPDLMLAATPFTNGLTIVTRDRSEFDQARVQVSNPREEDVRDGLAIKILPTTLCVRPADSSTCTPALVAKSHFDRAAHPASSPFSQKTELS
jgi:hypothetical protein